MFLRLSFQIFIMIEKVVEVCSMLYGNIIFYRCVIFYCRIYMAIVRVFDNIKWGK
jgi:hypothetical protein